MVGYESVDKSANQPSSQETTMSIIDNIKKLEATIAEIQGLPGVLRSFNFLVVQQKKG